MPKNLESRVKGKVLPISELKNFNESFNKYVRVEVKKIYERNYKAQERYRPYILRQ